MNEGCRQIEVLIGPFQEGTLRDENGNPRKGRAVSIVSNGNIGTMRVQASISKSRIPMENTADIIIYNLQRDTISLLNKNGLHIQVLAGYEIGNMELLFSGAVVHTNTNRQGPDFVTRIKCIAGGYSLMKEATSVSYTNGTSLKKIVTELAHKIPDVTVDPTKINVKGAIGYAGFSYVGNVKGALDSLGYQYGFSWDIDNGMFIVAMDDEKPRKGVVLDGYNGLRQVSPQLYGPYFIQVGLDIESDYVQGVRPGYSVTANTSFKKYGSYMIHTVSYNLCPKNDQWDMHISALIS